MATDNSPAPDPQERLKEIETNLLSGYFLDEPTAESDVQWLFDRQAQLSADLAILRGQLAIWRPNPSIEVGGTVSDPYEEVKEGRTIDTVLHDLAVERIRRLQAVAEVSTLRAQLQDEKARTKAATIEADLAFESEQKFKRRVIEAEADLTALRAQQDTTKGLHEIPSCPDGAVQALAGRLRLHAYDLVNGGTNASELRNDLNSAADALKQSETELAELRARLAVPPQDQEHEFGSKASATRKDAGKLAHGPSDSECPSTQSDNGQA